VTVESLNTNYQLVQLFSRKYLYMIFIY